MSSKPSIAVATTGWATVLLAVLAQSACESPRVEQAPIPAAPTTAEPAPFGVDARRLEQSLRTATDERAVERFLAGHYRSRSSAPKAAHDVRRIDAAEPVVAGDRSLESVQDSVLRVAARDAAGTVHTGAGFLVPGGRVVTAEHIVEHGGTVTLTDRRGHRIAATVESKNAGLDLAVLRVRPADVADLAPLELAASRARLGAPVYLIGNPSSFDWSVTSGVVSAYRELGGRVLLQTDAAINHGNSGGPIVGAGGQVLAFVSFRIREDGREGLGFGVAAESIRSALP